MQPVEGRIETRAFNRLPRGAHCEKRCVLTGRGFATLFDTGARRDPLVRSFNDLREIGVGKNTFGVRVARAQDSSALIHH
jgi:hypothetical protein